MFDIHLHSIYVLIGNECVYMPTFQIQKEENIRRNGRLSLALEPCVTLYKIFRYIYSKVRRRSFMSADPTVCSRPSA